MTRDHCIGPQKVVLYVQMYKKLGHVTTAKVVSHQRSVSHLRGLITVPNHSIIITTRSLIHDIRHCYHSTRSFYHITRSFYHNIRSFYHNTRSFYHNTTSFYQNTTSIYHSNRPFLLKYQIISKYHINLSQYKTISIEIPNHYIKILHQSITVPEHVY